MDGEGKQEVIVTDIRMSFGSMVVFMVKWAIAFIPAATILFVLGTIIGPEGDRHPSVILGGEVLGFQYGRERVS